MVERIGRFADGMGRRDVDLLAPVGLEARDLIAQFVVAFPSPEYE